MKLVGVFISLMLCLGAGAQTSNSVPSKTSGSDATASVQGTVVNPLTGKPLDGVHVMLVGWGAEETEIVYGAMSNSTGHFTLSHLPQGGYAIRVERRGFVQAVGKKGFAAHGILNLKPGEQVRDLVLQMVPRSIISGRVLDEYGDPMMGAYVAALATVPDLIVHASQTITTNDRGEFRIAVGPGKYRVRAALANFGPATLRRDENSNSTYVETYYPGVREMEAAKIVDIRPGTEMSGIEIKLLRSPIFSINGTISGVPAGATSAHVYAETVSATGASGIAGGEFIFIENEHSFALSRLSSGTYQVYARCTVGDQELQSAVVELTLTDSNIEGINLVLEPEFEVSGKVELEKGSEGAMQVKLHPAGSQSFERYRVGDVAPDGSFRIKNVFAERYRIEVDPKPENSFIKRVTINGVPASGNILDLSGGAQETRLKIVMGSDGGQVSGRALYGKDEGPAAFASVLLVPDQENVDAEDCQVDNATADGRYSFKGVAPGRYRIMAVKTLVPIAYQITEAVRRHREAGELLEVKEGEKVSRDVKMAEDEDTNDESE